MIEKKFMIGITVAFLASLLIIVSYITLGTQSPPNVSGPVGIRAETDKSSYALGEVVKIDIYLVNNTNETIKTVVYFRACDIFNSRGQSVWGGGTFYTWPSNDSITLQPFGEELFDASDPFEWNQDRIFTQGSELVSEKVGPGTYTIKLEVRTTFGYVYSETSCTITG